MNYTKFGCLLLFVFLKLSVFAFEKNRVYISSFIQKTDIVFKENKPITKTNYEIVFKLNDEKAIGLFNSYSIYYSYFDKVENIEAYTKNPTENGKFKRIDIKTFKKSNAKSSSVFYDDQTEIEIEFLGLTVGSEAYVNYTVVTEELHFTDPMTFKYYLPIEHLEYELNIPENVHVSFIEKNIPPNFLIFTKNEKRNETNYKWIAENIEPEKPMDNAPSVLYYTPHVIYKINDYVVKGQKTSVSNSPEDLFKWYISNIKQVNKKPSDRLKIIADSITQGATTEAEKVKKIYDWVKTNIRYVAFENGMEGLIPREAEAVCNKRYGDCKDMSSIQFGLLKALNIPVHLVWIGTRRIPYTYSEVPLKNTDNHMIAAYKNGNKWIYLDATDPNGKFGLPSDHIQGKQAMIYLTDSTYTLEIVPVVSAQENLFSEISTFTIIGNDIEINSVQQYNGLYAGNIANQLHYLTEAEKEDFAKEISKQVSNNALLKKYSFSSFSKNESPTIDVTYTIKDYIKEVGNEKYINLFLDKTFSNSTIKEENRTVPYSFSMNRKNEDTYIVDIPANYKLSYKPENTTFKNENFGFDISYTIENNKLICTQKIISNFPTLLMNADKFTEWNNFIKQLNKAYKESIILEKIK